MDDESKRLYRVAKARLDAEAALLIAIFWALLLFFFAIVLPIYVAFFSETKS